ncbi:MAG: Saccharopine dehydrogenase [Deltaproteobacteria bacterium]|nr:Saccharopine dehydrogenase [Deltaproteobacteria bacterium]
MKKVTLLGVGLQGRTILHDLTQSDLVSEVIAADRDLIGLRKLATTLASNRLTCVELDVNDADATAKLMGDADIVIETLPSKFCLPVAKLAVQNRVHLVNTMYLVDAGETDPVKRWKLEEEVRELDRRAREVQVTILPEFGMDPGIDLVLCGKAVKDLDEVHELYSYGAGFPEFLAADNPLRYKITWTFEGVLKSYFRPGRVLKEGRVVEIPADGMFVKENTHELDLEGFGRMEAYPNGDAVRYAEILGIRDQVRTMGRYVLRWPGHCEFWEKLANLHFLDDAPIKVGEVAVSPREFLRSLLEPQLQYGANERDVAVIRVDARGLKGGKRRRVIYQVIDKRDLRTGFTAMTRAVGFAASIGAQMILRGDIQKRGVLTPVRDVPFEIFSGELRKRGIHVEQITGSW